MRPPYKLISPTKYFHAIVISLYLRLAWYSSNFCPYNVACSLSLISLKHILIVLRKIGTSCYKKNSLLNFLEDFLQRNSYQISICLKTYWRLVDFLQISGGFYINIYFGDNLSIYHLIYRMYHIIRPWKLSIIFSEASKYNLILVNAKLYNFA